MISALGNVEECLTFTPNAGIFQYQLNGLLWVKLVSYYQQSAAHLPQLRVG